jgi:hypothetical protein
MQQPRLDAVVRADAHKAPALDDQQKQPVTVLLLDEGSSDPAPDAAAA